MALVSSDNDKYDVLEIIGRGAFGIIRKVRRKTDGHILCRKEINYIKMSQKEREQLTAEFTILSSLRHDNIVGYFQREHLKQTQELYLYMEYCGGGDLGMVIKNLKKTGELAKEEFVWRIFSQLITALYRCHYGIDAPEPGSDLARQKDPRTALKNKNQATMILHRDLKPENIFLGDDQSVKLGDFGLSKLMQSHDFASTYVGTPFYMSPEICAAEKYTLQSDIWSVGCIMYELCTHEPPFNANSHLQLVQRIRKGDFKPIPAAYSKDLGNVIASCLKTNPLHRPDTASLLTIPYVWIARKSQEIVRFGATLKTREEVAEYKLKQAEERLSALESDRATMKAEIEAQVRREWEVKAQLEITRQVKAQAQTELDRLRRKFDKEVDEKVAMLMEKHNQAINSRPSSRLFRTTPDVPTMTAPMQPTHQHMEENINPHSSVTTASGDEDFPSTTDLTDLSTLSLHSPSTSTSSRPIFPSKKTKTPFTRSKTTFDSPADIHMAEPSPMSISSLALSPRRNAAAQIAAAEEKTTFPGKNIFAEATRGRRNWEPTLAYTSDDSENEDEDDGSDVEILEQLSPTRPKGIPGKKTTDPFKMPAPVGLRQMAGRPGLIRQNTTATMQGMAHKPNLFPTTGNSKPTELNRPGVLPVASGFPRSATETDVRVKPASPNKRISKIPSRQDLNGHFNIAADASVMATGGISRSPSRKAVGSGLTSKLGGTKSNIPSSTGGDEMVRAMHSKNFNGPPSTAAGTGIMGGRTLVELAQARAGGRQINNGVEAGNKPKSSWTERDLPPVPVWDVDVLGEEGMPSPFLKREHKVIRGIR